MVRKEANTHSEPTKEHPPITAASSPPWATGSSSVLAQTAITEYQAEWLLSHRNFFVTVVEAGNPQFGVAAWLCLVRTLSWFIDGCLFTVYSHDGGEHSLGSLFSRKSYYS